MLPAANITFQGDFTVNTKVCHTCSPTRRLSLLCTCPRPNTLTVITTTTATQRAASGRKSTEHSRLHWTSPGARERLLTPGYGLQMTSWPRFFWRVRVTVVKKCTVINVHASAVCIFILTVLAQSDDQITVKNQWICCYEHRLGLKVLSITFSYF